MSDLTQQLAELRAQIEALPIGASAEAVNALEGDARRLLAAAKNTPQENDARDLFALLARRASQAAEVARSEAAPQASSGAVRGLLRRARIRIELAGDEDDIDEAVDILAEALDRDPLNLETRKLLQDAATHSPILAMKVRELFQRYSIQEDVQPVEPGKIFSPVPLSAVSPPVEPAPVQGEPSPSAPSKSKAEDAAALVSQMTQAYYSGDYQETVGLANRVIELQADNATAQEYRQKADDNILRGIVPDHRIPFEARVAYNRANSLVRAGNYDEAERLYREARDLAESAGIPSWKDAEQALLEIQDLALARELLSEGDRLMSADDWQDAIRKYEGALRVVPNDPLGQDRLEKARHIIAEVDQSQAQLSSMSGSLVDRAASLQKVVSRLAVTRQQLPGSTRLASLLQETTGQLHAIKSQLNDQARIAMSRVDSAMALDERLRMMTESISALEAAAQLDPGDQNLNAQLQEARQNQAQMQEGRNLIERASSLIAQNIDVELSQARSMLASL